MVHRYPAEMKAFYFKKDPTDAKVALGCDVLAPEGYGEIIGGSERIWDRELLMQRIREHNLPPESLEWYLDLRRFGSVPHGGFGMGLERTVAWICGLEHIREAVRWGIVDGANWQRRLLTNPPVVTVREQMGRGPFAPESRNSFRHALGVGHVSEPSTTVPFEVHRAQGLPTPPRFRPDAAI